MPVAHGARWPFLLLLAATACPRPIPEPQAPAAVATVAPSAPEPSVPVVQPSHPLELVPADARRILMIPSASRLAEAWDRDRLAARFPAQYQQARAVVAWILGIDLLDPAGMTADGVDPTAPLVFATLSDDALVVLGRVSDASRLLEVASAAAPKGSDPAEPETVGDAEILRVEGRALVLRHDLFAWVITDPRRSDIPDHAKEIARLDPATSLARSKLLERAHVDPSGGADLLGVLDMAAIRRDEEARYRTLDPSLRSKLDAHRGAVADRPDDDPPELARQRAFRETVEAASFLGPMLLPYLALEVDVVGFELRADERGVRGQVYVEHDDAGLRRLVQPAEHPPLSMARLGDAPLLLFGGRLDLDVGAELVAGFVPITGSTVPLDFLRELRPVLDGRASLALMASPTPGPEPLPDPGTLLHGTVALGIADEARARALLDAWVERWPGRRLRAAKDVDGYVLETTGWPRRLWVGVVEGWVLSTTDPGVLRRVRTGSATESPSWPWASDRPGDAFFAFHHRLPFLEQWVILPLLARSEERDIDEILAMVEFPGEDLTSIPRSAKTRRLERELARLRREQDRIALRRHEERAMDWWRTAEALGLTTAVLRTRDTGFTIDVSHDVPLGRWVETELSMRKRLDDEHDRVMERIRKREPDPAEKRLDEANRRAVDARREDIERALGRKSPPDLIGGDRR